MIACSTPLECVSNCFCCPECNISHGAMLYVTQFCAKNFLTCKHPIVQRQLALTTYTTLGWMACKERTEKRLLTTLSMKTGNSKKLMLTNSAQKEYDPSVPTLHYKVPFPVAFFAIKVMIFHARKSKNTTLCSLIYIIHWLSLLNWEQTEGGILNSDVRMHKTYYYHHAIPFGFFVKFKITQ